MQPIGEATGETPEEEVEEEKELVGKLAILYLNRPNPDKTFGIRKKGMHHYIGNKHVIISQNDIVVDGETILGRPGLWELLTSKIPQNYNTEDYADYSYLMIKTNAFHHDYDPNNPSPRSSGGKKWKEILSPIWHNREKYEKKGWYEGEGVVVIPSDPYALLERLDLILASQEAGHTGVGNEVVSICDELKRQGVLDTKTYKKLNSIIKK